MIVYQTDRAGFYVGTTQAHESPLEPGVWHIPAGCVEEAPPTIVPGFRPRFVDGAWVQVAWSNGGPTPPPLSPEDALALEREGWRPYIRAFRAALKMFPAPGKLHMLDAVTQQVAAAKALDPYDDQVIWFETVTIVLRVHPDMEAFRVAFGLTPETLDLVFRAAVRLDNGEDAETVQAWVDAIVTGGDP